MEPTTAYPPGLTALQTSVTADDKSIFRMLEAGAPIFLRAGLPCYRRNVEDHEDFEVPLDFDASNFSRELAEKVLEQPPQIVEHTFFTRSEAKLYKETRFGANQWVFADPGFTKFFYLATILIVAEDDKAEENPKPTRLRLAGFWGCLGTTEEFITHAETVCAKAYEAFAVYEETVKPQQYINFMVPSQNGVNTVRSALRGAEQLTLIRENYSEEVCADYDYLVSQLLADQMRGRLFILQGDPGTGKTQLLRAMLADPAFDDKSVDFVFASLEEVLLLRNKGNFLSFIQKFDEKRICLIVEDADALLVPTARSDNTEAFSAFLNLIEGIPGAAADLAVIMTTNAATGLEKSRAIGFDESRKTKAEWSIDRALQRAGRLNRLTQVKPLNIAQATKVLKRLTDWTPEAIQTFLKARDAWTLADLYYVRNK